MGTLLRNVLFLLVALAIYAYRPTKQRLVTLGLTRGSIIENVHGSGLRVIEDTRHCEDLHLWKVDVRSALLFTACEGRGSPRFKWFPPMTFFEGPEELGSGDMTGSIYVLDPEVSFSSFVSFSSPFRIFCFRSLSLA
jgi:hypothetical protein